VSGQVTTEGEEACHGTQLLVETRLQTVAKWLETGHFGDPKKPDGSRARAARHVCRLSWPDAEPDRVQHGAARCGALSKPARASLQLLSRRYRDAGSHPQSEGVTQAPVSCMSNF